jgi:hypothetical protein
MTGGIFSYLFEAQDVIRQTGVTFDEALAIVHAAHAPEPESNVIRMADYVRQKDEKTIGAL